MRRSVSPPIVNLEHWSIFPESSVGQERLVRLSHNTVDVDLNVISPPSEAVVYLLVVV